MSPPESTVLRPATNRDPMTAAVQHAPSLLVSWFACDTATLEVRRLRRSDTLTYRRLFDALDPDSTRACALTLLQPVQEPLEIPRTGEEAFIAISHTEECSRGVALVRSAVDSGNVRAEFLIAVSPDVEERGLRPMLLAQLIDYYRRRQTHELVGEARASDEAAVALGRAFWFRVCPARQGGFVTLRRTLGPLVTAG